jgi:hypothetical protein
MVEIILASRYFVVFLPAGGCTQPIDDFPPCAAFSHTEAHQLARNGSDPDFPFADPEAVVMRTAHPEGKWGEHSCARYVAGKMVFPFT